MKSGWNLVLGAVAVTAAFSAPAFAISATTFSSFEGEEEPTVIYNVAGNNFGNDGFDNMTSPSSGVFRFYLRYAAGSWDGDRNMTSTDRQRAEVKGLGARQKPGETFEYSHTWKTSRAGNGGFWHVFQLKGVDGDNDMPLVTDAIKSGTGAVVQSWSGTDPAFIQAKSYTIAVNAFTTTNIRVKPSATATGSIQAAINGGAMSGRTNVPLFRPGSTEYRPKWGSYRGVATNSGYGNDTVEQKAITATKK